MRPTESLQWSKSTSFFSEKIGRSLGFNRHDEEKKEESTIEEHEKWILTQNEKVGQRKSNSSYEADPVFFVLVGNVSGEGEREENSYTEAFFED